MADRQHEPQQVIESQGALEVEINGQERLVVAEELKQEGNDHFRAKRWEDALAAYKSALGRLPIRHPAVRETAQSSNKGKERADEDADRPEDDPKPSNEDDETSHPARTRDTEEPPSELDLEYAKARAVLNANIGACYVKLGEHEEAVASCTQALVDDPQYVKALQRRAASNEQLDTWSSLSSAQEDYQQLLTILPPSSPQVRDIKRSLAVLKPRVEAAQKRETAEMMDKLKGLGNSILGNFGLSTDNFQFVPNGEGGYSMNFVR